ncbi:tryptophan halogenase family protein [Teredinibacter sp. KSP-S5-2]|uniref:tryptophan halogenase family protein n=1 Tax=Teredinibacter sp. KSP-S5-2 TaxID=3034506 RepID=UPI002934CEBF|nr:tryptophan halogenase family protein [Teredinibacter sp. KSP-S5-2]WNO09264.1 tryptophan 7-halogenase [Teredinibacter sp. KSP-S5-2]
MVENRAIRSIVIIGGGTAGWLAANHLGKKLSNTEISIRLIESKNIPTIGVGEGTVPEMRNTLMYFGIRETDFMQKCHATFKQSIKFVDWVDSGNNDYYHHVFDPPRTRFNDLSAYWIKKEVKKTTYANAISAQSHLCDDFKAPKLITTPEFDGGANYAYHLDAAKFSMMLKENATKKYGVIHIEDEVLEACLNSLGYIDSVRLMSGSDIEADFFVDCSGFSSLLVGDALKVPFIDKGKYLFVDTALTVQVPYENLACEVPPYTISTAKKNGWIWDIGLTNRKGIGYVYSSKYTDDSQAEETLRKYLGPESNIDGARKIPMKIGYREKFWEKNCVAIGLSAGFVEPLEATGLLAFDVSSRLLAEKIPTHFNDLDKIEKQYNKYVKYIWDRIIDFVKLHYFISRRRDSQFWLDNVSEDSAPDTLKERLDLWKRAVPTTFDFFSRFDVFNLDNYLYVLYGMKHLPELDDIRLKYCDDELAEAEFSRIRKESQSLNERLPGHRELLDKINKYGFQVC